MYRHLYCTLEENIIQFFRSVSLIYQQLHIHAHLYLIWYIYIYIYRHTLTSVYDIYSCVLFLHISYGFPDSLVIPQCKSGISGSPAVAVVGSPFFFTIFTMIFVCKSAWDSGIPSYPYIYIVHIPKIAPRYTSPELWILKSLSSEAFPDLSLFVRASTAEMTPNGSHDQTRFCPSTTVRHVSTRPLSVCGFLLLFGGRLTGWKSYSLKGSCIVHPYFIWKYWIPWDV